LVAEGKVYLRTGDGDVRIFEEGREMKKPVKVDGLPDLENGSVVAANGVLYIAGKGTLYAVASGK
ncbi:MAG TPA: pyrrolo-quinoline quinone, partial [Planctomycetota bacterium]|nr:pyrrolo-quinoline quinone [Planctomycetota bacterium]